MTPFKWYYAGGADPECWWLAGDSREEAIASGRDSHEDGFSIVEARMSEIPRSADWFEDHADHELHPDEYVVYPDRIFEDWTEANCELWSEDGPDDTIPEEDYGRLKVALEAAQKIESPWDGKPEQQEQVGPRARAMGGAFDAWLQSVKDKIRVWAFAEMRNQEYFPPPEED